MQVRKQVRNALLILVIAEISVVGNTQAIRVNRRQMSVRPDTAVNSLSVSVSPSSVSFSLVSNGVATGNSAIQINTSWSPGFCTPTCTINLYGYFANGTAALTEPVTGANIPSSAVLGQVPTGTPTTYAAFTQTGPLGGSAASLLLLSDVEVTHTSHQSRTDALSLEIDLSSQPTLPAGTYTGTLYVQAQTF